MVRRPVGAAGAAALGLLLLVVAGCGTPGSGPGTPSFAVPPPTTSTDTSSGRAVVVDCDHTLVERPTDIVLTCGDGGEQLTGLVWTLWTAERAEGTGDESIVECRPTCAQGRRVSFPATVVLTDARPYPQRPDRWFARAVIAGGPSGNRVVELGTP